MPDLIPCRVRGLIMDERSKAPKRVWACSSLRSLTARASTEKAALTGLT